MSDWAIAAMVCAGMATIAVVEIARALAGACS